VLEIKSPGGGDTPQGMDHKEYALMDTLSVQEAKTARMCRILRESEERLMLLDRIRRLRKRLEA
jgi:hypothetical protein